MILQKVLGSPGIIHFKAKSSFCLHDFSCYIFRLQIWVDALFRDCWEALSSLVCPSVHRWHRWHLHLSEFYDILDHTDHTFSRSSWHPLTFWPSDHSPTQTHRTVGPTKPTQNPDLTIYGVLHYTYKPDIFWNLMAPTFLWQWVLATATYWKSSWRKKWAQITRYKHILFKFRI